MATRYLVTRLRTETDTSRVILLHAPEPKRDRNYIRRIEKISPWRHVGVIESSDDTLDRITGEYGVTDEALFRRTGVDVRSMTL